MAFVLDTVNIVKNLNVCNAFIFSGHTAYSVLLASVWVIYSSNLIVNLVGIVLALVTIFFVSFNRLHYTVDIVLAVIISLFLLLVHHLLLRIGVLEKVKEDAASSVGGAEKDPPTLQKKLETRRSHWLICVLVALVRWIDARHLESSNEEEDSLL